MYAQDSIDLLQNSGIQFKKHEEDGIDPFDFAELLMTSGIVLMDNIKWLSFHSGYDFGYLLKLLTDQNLPSEEGDFFELLRMYFPNIYDVKYLMKSCKNLKGGLQEVADQLELRRVGPQHQAGSDSHLTGLAFFKMREVYDSVEFRLALKRSEERLFWRCADEAPVVVAASSDTGSSAASSAKDSRATGANSAAVAERTATAVSVADGSEEAKSSTDTAAGGSPGGATNVAEQTNAPADSGGQASGDAAEIEANISSSASSDTDASATGSSDSESASAANSTANVSADSSGEPTETDINQNIVPKHSPSDE